MSALNNHKVSLGIIVAFISQSILDVDGFTVSSWNKERDHHPYGKIKNSVVSQSYSHRTRIPQISSSATTSSILLDNDTFHNQPTYGNLFDLSKYTTTHQFNHVLNDLANQCLDDTLNQQKDVISLATLAEALALKVEQQPIADIPFQLNWSSYHTLIKVWTRAAQCLSEGHGRGNVHDTFHSYDSIPPELLLHGGIYSARDAVVRATSILQGLESKYIKGESPFGPDIQGYNTIFEAWSKCSCKDGVEKCHELLQKLLQLSRDHHQERKTITTTTELAINHEEDVRKWKKSLTPNAYTYSLFMDTLLHAEETEETIQKIISLEQKLELEYNMTKDPAMKPTISTIGNRIIHAYGKSNFLLINKDKQGMDDSEEIMKKNAIPWQAARKAHEVFSMWYRRYKDTGDDDYKPDSMSFTFVLDSYARCGDKSSIDKAQQLFDFMIKEWKESGDDRVQPLSRTFTAVVTALSKSLDPNAPQKVETLLQMMEDLYQQDVEKGLTVSSLLKPNIRTYTAAISSWGHSKDPTKPQRALRILKKCIDEHKKTGSKDMKPTLYAYNCCISACSNLGGATFEQQAQALKIAFSVNKAIAAASLEANHFTYATLLKVVTNLMATGTERDTVAEALFVKCSKTGYVDVGVLKNLRLAASNSLYHRLLNNVTDKNGFLNVDDIPKEWSRKVHTMNNNG